MIYGLELRYVLTVMLLDAGGPLSIAELLAELTRAGLALRGRPGKTVSDALRWEVGKGRVVRIGRATYAPGRMPRSTQWWIRRRVEHVRQSAVALTLARPVGA
jgi:hypothetical protein